MTERAFARPMASEADQHMYLWLVVSGVFSVATIGILVSAAIFS